MEYRATNHAEDRSQERVTWLNRQQIEDLARNGSVVLETTTHRYVKNGHLRFPCVKESNGYVIKTVITPDLLMSAKD